MQLAIALLPFVITKMYAISGYFQKHIITSDRKGYFDVLYLYRMEISQWGTSSFPDLLKLSGEVHINPADIPPV